MSREVLPHDARPPSALSDRVKAIALMMLAVAMFSALDSTAKYLVTREHLPVAEVAWSRFIGQFLGLLLMVPALGLMTVRQLFTTNVPKLQLVRSVLMMATTALNFMALVYLRLDQTITIVFLAPLVVALLAGPLLGEWVGWRRMTAIVAGFVGVMIAMHPDASGLHPAVIYSFAAMLAYALFMILTRHMATFDPPIVTLFYSMFVGTFLGAPFALADWQMPSGALSWILLASLGLMGGTGHWLFLHAYRLAPASSVAPFLYTQLLTMVAFGYLVFGDVPDAWTLTGATVVVASGIYLFHREQVTQRERRMARRPGN
jgi:drug/metabolite transporter (DMT)-like permease